MEPAQRGCKAIAQKTPVHAKAACYFTAEHSDIPAPIFAARLALVGWVLFWGLNGLDGFLGRSEPALSVMGRDLLGLGVAESNTALLLQAFGFWQLLVAMPFLGTLLLLRSAGSGEMLSWMLVRGLGMAGLTFIFLMGFDLFATDGRGLWQHGLCLVLLMVSGVMAWSNRLVLPDGYG